MVWRREIGWWRLRIDSYRSLEKTSGAVSPWKSCRWWKWYPWKWTVRHVDVSSISRRPLIPGCKTKMHWDFETTENICECIHVCLSFNVNWSLGIWINANCIFLLESLPVNSNIYQKQAQAISDEVDFDKRLSICFSAYILNFQLVRWTPFHPFLSSWLLTDLPTPTKTNIHPWLSAWAACLLKELCF